MMNMIEIEKNKGMVMLRKAIVYEKDWKLIQWGSKSHGVMTQYPYSLIEI